jgi:REP element-mobilizing transposase RayT
VPSTLRRREAVRDPLTDSSRLSPTRRSARGILGAYKNQAPGGSARGISSHRWCRFSRNAEASFLQKGPVRPNAEAIALLARPVPYSRSECEHHALTDLRRGRTVLQGRSRRRIGPIAPKISRRRLVELVEGPAPPDHVHLWLTIPARYSAAHGSGFTDGRSPVRTRRESFRECRMIVIQCSLRDSESAGWALMGSARGSTSARNKGTTPDENSQNTSDTNRTSCVWLTFTPRRANLATSARPRPKLRLFRQRRLRRGSRTLGGHPNASVAARG